MLTKQQRVLYSRNIALDEIGEQGQDALLESKVLLVGVGGLGSAAAYYLAAAGVGTLGLIDGDRVDLSNLQRQILYDIDSVGKSKSLQAAKRIKSFAPQITINTHQKRLTEDNYQDALTSYDVIADCSDNFTTRFLVNRFSVENKVPLVSGAAIGLAGHLSIFRGYLATEPCYQCFCPEIPNEDNQPNCSSGGVLGSIVGVIGSLQATEIIKILLGNIDTLSCKMIRYDAKTSSFKNSIIKKDKDCKLCQDINA